MRCSFPLVFFSLRRSLNVVSGVFELKLRDMTRKAQNGHNTHLLTVVLAAVGDSSAISIWG